MSTILLVDDDKAVLGLAKVILESDGHRVYAVESATEAIAVATELQCSFNLLLTDMVMPKTDGHALILAIRRICPNVRTMAMSGALLGDFSERDYVILPKPFTRDQLLAAVKEILRERGRAAGG